MSSSNEAMYSFVREIYDLIDNLSQKYEGTKIRILFYFWLKITGIIVRKIINCALQKFT